MSSTHRSGHTLDLLITRADDDLITSLSTYDADLSDHFVVNCNLTIEKPSCLQSIAYGNDINVIALTETRSSQANMLLPNFCRTYLFRASFFNRIVFLWNGLPFSIRDISFVSSFKHNLFSHYLSKLNSDFDVDRMRSWKTFCSKCRSYNINCCS